MRIVKRKKEKEFVPSQPYTREPLLSRSLCHWRPSCLLRPFLLF